MVAPEELKSACEVIIRQIIGNDELWNKLPAELREEMTCEEKT